MANLDTDTRRELPDSEIPAYEALRVRHKELLKEEAM